MSNKLTDAINKLQTDSSNIKSSVPAINSSKSGSSFLVRLVVNLLYLGSIIGVIAGVIYYKKTQYEKKCNGPVNFNTVMYKIFGLLDPPDQNICANNESGDNNKGAANNSQVIDILPNDVLPIVLNNDPAILRKEKEVFNISNPIFSYNNAVDICRAQFNGRLATEEEVLEAANKGSHWCVPSWSSNKQLLYPIQKDEYKQSGCDNNIPNEVIEKLNNVNSIVVGKSKNYSNVADLPDFGINCYGYKPDPEQLMKLNNLPRPKKTTISLKSETKVIPDLFKEQDLFS